MGWGVGGGGVTKDSVCSLSYKWCKQDHKGVGYQSRTGRCPTSANRGEMKKRRNVGILGRGWWGEGKKIKKEEEYARKCILGSII